jgi:hypothetical protein
LPIGSAGKPINNSQIVFANGVPPAPSVKARIARIALLIEDLIHESAP